MGFLPYDLFPRHGRWTDLAARALVYHMTMGCVQENPNPNPNPNPNQVYHMTMGCVQEKSPCFSPGVRPFRGNRQRLDRCDET